MNLTLQQRPTTQNSDSYSSTDFSVISIIFKRDGYIVSSVPVFYREKHSKYKIIEENLFSFSDNKNMFENQTTVLDYKKFNDNNPFFIERDLHKRSSDNSWGLYYDDKTIQSSQSKHTNKISDKNIVEFASIIECNIDLKNFSQIKYLVEKRFLGKRVFIRSNNNLYGPFVANIDTPEMGETVLLQPLGYKKILKQDFILEIPINDMTNNMIFSHSTIQKYSYLNIWHEFIKNLDEFLQTAKNNSREIDFISDEELIKWGENKYKGIISSKYNDIEEIQKIIVDLKNNVEHDKDYRDRSKRYESLENAFQSFKVEKRRILEEFLKKDHDFIKDFFMSDEERQKILKNIFPEYEVISQQDYDLLSSKFDQVSKDLEKSIKESEEIKNARDFNEVDAQEVRNELLKEISPNQQDIEKIKDILSTYKELKDLYEKIGVEKNELSKLEQEIDKLKETKKSIGAIETLNGQYKDLADKTKENAVKYLENIAPVLPLFGINQDLFAEKDMLSSEQNLFTEENQNFLEIPNAYKSIDLITELEKRFKSYDRHIERIEIANLLINYAQNFMTVILGEPGVGKTSLVKTFTKVIGMTNKKNYIQVQTQSNWCSEEDFLGSYNILSGKFEYRSNNILFQLKNIEDKENINSPFLFLLDEANLSPIEHYWSSFLDMIDNSERSLQIKISHDKQSINIHPNVRFFATINNDETTRKLSKRFINRTAFIHIDYPKDYKPSSSVRTKEQGYHKISYNAIKELFGCMNTPSILSNNEIKEVLRRFEILHRISPRKKKMLDSYLQSSYKISTEMGIEKCEFIDLAILQLLLPEIEGSGEKYSSGLNLFCSFIETEGYIRTNDRLKAIIERGQQSFNQYSYF